MLRGILVIASFLGFCTFSAAQPNPILTNKGGVIFVNINAKVKINGAAHNDRIAQDTGKFLNRGNVYIESYFKNDAVTEGQGYFEVAGTWENNSIFRHGNGVVRLDGSGTQLISGDSATHFYDLFLAGTGNIKKQTVDAYTEHLLDLANKELATEIFTMYVTNPDFNAITRSTGFVSSLENGWLSRTVSLPTNYIFPVGSSIGQMRYRPVGISPKVIAPEFNQFKVRMVNHIADIDGFNIGLHDSTICYENPYFYHWISHSQGNSTAAFRLYYEPIDGEYDVNAHWDTQTPTMWYKTEYNWAYHGSTPYYVLTEQWTDFNPYPFILARVAPVIDSLVCVPELCGGAMGSYFVGNWVPDASYVWNVDGGTIIGPDDGTQVDVVWQDTGYGTVTVYQELLGGACHSNELSCSTHVLPQPDANFAYQPTTIYAWDYVQFQNLTTPDGTYTWYFNDTHSSTETDPGHIYENVGIYLVQLIAVSPEGCVDTVVIPVPVIEGLDIPNVFTPDGDGYNDVFRVLSSGMENYSLRIYNRWGNLIFETSTPRAGWDGRTNAGEWVPSGTYYYILTGQGTLEPYERTGFITLVK
ncbi:MAG: gliding motility-associated C-terminal domain-containing protein [Bacteroidetes bacterium]|nr:gliding motility-associated C-terminal domain-containing protein [Bacteroidota bacterium]MBU1718811.1 gliding motility-associated C-terminal domain-containing protein [Bacteroidota bacterium]